jgi:hypothetical protein
MFALIRLVLSSTAFGCVAEEETAERALVAWRGLADSNLVDPNMKNAAAAITSTGTMTNAQTHPGETDGFDKMILLR